MNAIEIENLTIRFNLASEEISSIKEYFIKLAKRQLNFQEFFALKNISFNVEKGDSIGLVGANGSGKSTLLKAISGIYPPYEGSVRVNGIIAPLIELGAGFDGQLTARENIYLNGALFGYDRTFMDDKFDEIVDFAELRDFIDVPVRNYSSGMAARLGFAAATIVKPDILICDEVLAVGDMRFQQKCEEKMEELMSNGTTLLFVSHSIEQVRKVCKNAVWLEHGVMKMKGEVNEVCDSYVKELMGEM